MIEENALIISLHGDLAEVEIQRSTACGDCSAKNGCGSAVFSSLFGKRRTRTRVLNRIQARPGEQVVIGLHEAPFLRAAFALYATPLLAMIGGAMVGEWLAQRSASGYLELGSLIGGLSGLAVGLGWLRRFARRSQSDSQYRAVVLRKAGNGNLYIPFP
jgi:sigma-E factor negative regulatory protein RseC